MNFNENKKYEYENGFYLTSDVSRIGKLLAHYELYKKIINITGDVVECGVYKGASLVRFATFRECLESQYSRKIIGFDAFGAFPRVDRDDDNKFIDTFENQGGDGLDIKDLKTIFENKNILNYELVKGDLTKTVDKYIKEHPALKISLLHIDVDVYKPTWYVLEKLYSRVVSGGIVILDDYGMVNGATEAIDKFIKNMNKNIKILKIPYYSVPGYIIKD